MTNIYEQGSSLEKLLSTLKKNRENVPLEILKTQYKEPYEALVRQISQTATSFVKAVITDRLILNPDISIDEQTSVINQTIAGSGMEKEMSSCISRTYSLEQLYQLALVLRKQIEQALWPYIHLKTCRVFDLNVPDMEPVIYNPLTRQVYRDGAWINQELNLWGKCVVYGNLNEYFDKETLPKQEENEHENNNNYYKQPVKTGNAQGLPQDAAPLLENRFYQPLHGTQE